jgi:hypothetical protein
MTYTIILLERAVKDANKAFLYYEDQQAGLGNKFEASLYKILFYIENYPLHFKIIHKKFRQTLIPKFPYVIVYRIVRRTIFVQSMFHTSRSPKKKYKK